MGITQTSVTYPLNTAWQHRSSSVMRLLLSWGFFDTSSLLLFAVFRVKSMCWHLNRLSIPSVRWPPQSSADRLVLSARVITWKLNSRFSLPVSYLSSVFITIFRFRQFRECFGYPSCDLGQQRSGILLRKYINRLFVSCRCICQF